MTSWMIEALGNDLRDSARHTIGEHLLADIGYQPSPRPALFDFTMNGFVLAAHSLMGDEERTEELREASELAFEALRATPAPMDNEGRALHILHTACYGVLGERTPDVRRYVRNNAIPEPLGAEWDWGSRVRNGVYRLWLLLVRKDGWTDLDAVLARTTAR